MQTNFFHSAALRCLLVTWFVVCVVARVDAQFSFEEEPINYGQTPATDRVAKLAEKLRSGKVRLDYDQKNDYLPAILRELDVPTSSQMLVFSKTSLQIHRISPTTPRAIYFNDDVYVGWVQDGYMIEFAAMDDVQGGVFYSLRLDGGKPRISRDNGCLSCHATMRTQRVPGFFIRSVFPREDGRPRETGTVTDHRSPFAGRWGGWYVTGTHGDMRHIGNEIASDPEVSEKVDVERGANLLTLSDRIDTSSYPTPGSDLVALLVMEHQMQMQNYITLASFETRKAMELDRVANAEAGRSVDFQSEATIKRIATAGDKLVEYMLFCDEAKLDSPVAGSSEFAAEFVLRGPQDKQGRSLRQLDLQTRLFRYPCSYLIHSSSFDALPGPMSEYVRKRVLSILRGDEAANERFAHLSAADRNAILEILVETKPSWFTF